MEAIMPALTDEQLREFLSSGDLLMRLATITPDGWPAVNPLWYFYEDGAFLLGGRRQAQWVENIRQNPRVSASIDTTEAIHTRALIEGTAEIVDPAWLGDWKAWAVRYMGEERGGQYYDDTKHIPRALVRITPRKIVTWSGSTWHPRYLK
jgi:PPOX class probable F420-dependent enzyme|tara:strand:- start:1732 stop:2181 length:450 start_codon:yes stop_codon:yes gene_type:complete